MGIRKRGYSGRGGNGGGSVAAAVCFTLFLFSAAVVLILNFRGLYYADVTWLHLDESSGMSTSAIQENFDALIRYNQVWNQGALVFPSLEMSQEGAIHFREVKRIFDGIWIVFALTGGISLVYLLKTARQPKRRFWLCSGILSLGIPAVLGALVAWKWDWFFVTFHRLVFRNDYWLFDPATDPVINILPDTYFMHCAIGILAVIVAGSLLCFNRYRKS